MASAMTATDRKKLKVQELRDELAMRGLETDGVKAVLLERLEESIAEEKKMEAAAAGADLPATAEDEQQPQEEPPPQPEDEAAAPEEEAEEPNGAADEELEGDDLGGEGVGLFTMAMMMLTFLSPTPTIGGCAK